MTVSNLPDFDNWLIGMESKTFDFGIVKLFLSVCVLE